jgi:hypothetical protein
MIMGRAATLPDDDDATTSLDDAGPTLTAWLGPILHCSISSPVVDSDRSEIPTHS